MVLASKSSRFSSPLVPMKLLNRLRWSYLYYWEGKDSETSLCIAIYVLSTRCLHRYLCLHYIYTISTRYLHDVYTMSTYICLHDVYRISTRCLHIHVYAMSTRYLHYVYTYDVQDIYTMSTYMCALSPIWVSWLTVFLHLQTLVNIPPVWGVIA